MQITISSSNSAPELEIVRREVVGASGKFLVADIYIRTDEEKLLVTIISDEPLGVKGS